MYKKTNKQFNKTKKSSSKLPIANANAIDITKGKFVKISNNTKVFVPHNQQVKIIKKPVIANNAELSDAYINFIRKKHSA